MRVAFRTRALRTLIENQASAEHNLGIKVAAALRARVADIVSAQTINDLIAGAPEKMQDGIIQVSLGPTAYLRLKPNHSPAPRCDDGSIDWSSVTRIQITDIEANYG